jgi:hypothetical protein
LWIEVFDRSRLKAFEFLTYNEKELAQEEGRTSYLHYLCSARSAEELTSLLTNTSLIRRPWSVKELEGVRTSSSLSKSIQTALDQQIIILKSINKAVAEVLPGALKELQNTVFQALKNPQRLSDEDKEQLGNVSEEAKDELTNTVSNLLPGKPVESSTGATLLKYLDLGATVAVRSLLATSMGAFVLRYAARCTAWSPLLSIGGGLLSLGFFGFGSQFRQVEVLKKRYYKEGQFARGYECQYTTQLGAAWLSLVTLWSLSEAFFPSERTGMKLYD